MKKESKVFLSRNKVFVLMQTSVYGDLYLGEAFGKAM